MIISVFTVVAFKIGLTEGLTITFFPMIILSWTIERMSILWEEEGAKEVVAESKPEPEAKEESPYGIDENEWKKEWKIVSKV